MAMKYSPGKNPLQVKVPSETTLSGFGKKNKVLPQLHLHGNAGLAMLPMPRKFGLCSRASFYWKGLINNAGFKREFLVISGKIKSWLNEAIAIACDSITPETQGRMMNVMRAVVEIYREEKIEFLFWASGAPRKLFVDGYNQIAEDLNNTGLDTCKKKLKIVTKEVEGWVGQLDVSLQYIALALERNDQLLFKLLLIAVNGATLAGSYLMGWKK